MEHEVEALERAGWDALTGKNAVAFYDDVMTDDAVMIFPFGVMDRSTSLAGMEASPWERYELEDVRVHPLTDHAAAVTYRVRASGAGREINSVMSSTYVRSGDRWRLALHQQSPDAEGAAP